MRERAETNETACEDRQQEDCQDCRSVNRILLIKLFCEEYAEQNAENGRKSRMTKERDIQKLYEMYKNDEIDVTSLSGSELWRINQMLDEELEEKMRMFSELEELINGASFVEDPKRKPPKLF